MGLMANANYLKQIMYHPCAAPNPQVIIETAIEAAIPVLIELEEPGCIDYAKAALGISWRCGRAIKALAKKIIPPKVVDAAHAIYEPFAPVEAALYGFLLADLASEFLVNWTSLMYASQDCNQGNDVYCATTLGAGVDILGTPEGAIWTLFGCALPNGCAGAGVGTVTVAPGCSVDVTAHVTTEPCPFPGCSPSGSITLQLRDNRGQVLGTSNPYTDPGTGKTTSIVMANVKTPPQIIGEYTISCFAIGDGHATMTDAGSTVDGSGNPITLFPLPCNPFNRGLINYG